MKMSFTQKGSIPVMKLHRFTLFPMTSNNGMEILPMDFKIINKIYFQLELDMINCVSINLAYTRLISITCKKYIFTIELFFFLMNKYF